MKCNEFGKYFRILRIKNGEVLADAKEFLGASISFISSVECGNKAVPDDWFKKLSDHYNLSEKEKRELKDAIDKSKKVLKINISNSNDLRKNVALQFQRSFEEVDDDTLLEIQKLLERRRKEGGL